MDIFENIDNYNWKELNKYVKKNGIKNALQSLSGKYQDKRHKINCSHFSNFADQFENIFNIKFEKFVKFGTCNFDLLAFEVEMNKESDNNFNLLDCVYEKHGLNGGSLLVSLISMSTNSYIV